MFKLTESGTREYNEFGIRLSTPYEYYESDPYNNFSISLFKKYWWWHIPMIIKPRARWVDLQDKKWASSDGYMAYDQRSYYLGYDDSMGYVHYNYGIQRNDGNESASGCFQLPWKATHQVRHEVFRIKPECGYHVTDTDNRINAMWNSPYAKNPKPQSEFQLLNEQRYNIKDREEAFMHGSQTPYFIFFRYNDPYDGSETMCRCHVEEREWRYGWSNRFPKFWQKLMSWKEPIVQRSLVMDFKDEIGPRKGSWKGGTIGTSIEMRTYESIESAFFRFREQEIKDLLHRC